MATIRDVARAAGVSIATVSRVFNDSPRVSDDARRRVWSAATALDYWPNSAARSLTTSRTHALGVLLPDLFGEFFSEVIRGIDHAARVRRFQIFLSSSHADTEELVLAARAMRGRIDGLIAMVPDRGSAAAVEQIARYFPIVLLNPRFQVTGCSTVSIANVDGARSLMAHLARLGHRRIAMLAGPAGNIDAEDRLQGYRQGLAQAGLPIDPALVIEGDFGESSGYRAGRELLRANPRPTAVFAANDYMAIGVMSAFREAGLDVPGDIAVAGFDDIAIAQYLSPSLTTVHVDAYELGEKAVAAWMSHVEGNGDVPAHHTRVSATLVVRSSCGSPEPRPVDLWIDRRRGAAPADAAVEESLAHPAGVVPAIPSPPLTAPPRRDASAPGDRSPAPSGGTPPLSASAAPAARAPRRKPS